MFNNFKSQYAFILSAFILTIFSPSVSFGAADSPKDWPKYNADTRQNQSIYNEVKSLSKDKMKDYFVIHLNMYGQENAEALAGSINTKNLNNNYIAIDLNYRDYLAENKLNVELFQKAIIERMSADLSQVRDVDLSGKTIVILNSHGGDRNILLRYIDSKITSKYIRYIDVNDSGVFKINPEDYSNFAYSIIKTVSDNMKSRKIQIKQIEYTTPQCGIDAKSLSILVKNYKTERSIDTIETVKGHFFVEKSDQTLADIVFSYLKNKDFDHPVTISFCSAEHCYNRSPVDMIRFLNTNKTYTVSELFFDGTSGYELGIMNMSFQNPQEYGFFGEDTLMKMKNGELKPLLKGKVKMNEEQYKEFLSSVKFQDFALSTKKINRIVN